jgi:hypothetical protein
VNKVVVDLDKRMGPMGMLLALLEIDFFDTAKTLREITIRCNVDSEKEHKSNYFSFALDKYVREHRLEKIEGGKVHKFVKGSQL